MDAITIIKRDHRAVEEAYEHYKNALTNEEKKRWADEILQSLDKHAKMEEKYFYPALEKEGQKEEALIEEAEDEHADIKALVMKAKALDVVGIDLDETMENLMNAVTHHVAEEEEEILPQAEADLSDTEREELGRKMETLSPSAKEKKRSGKTKKVSSKRRGKTTAKRKTSGKKKTKSRKATAKRGKRKTRR